jgi:hypothetical protein
MKPYNARIIPSYNYWNVSLWISNDEGLYRSALDCIRQHSNKDDAARAFLAMLTDNGMTKTPDGVPYKFTYIRYAMGGLE